MKRPPVLATYPISTLRELFLEATRRYADRVALKSKREGVWQPTTYVQLKVKVNQLATFFFQIGLKQGDPVALLSENRIEWAIAYLAAVGSGFVVVPIDKDLKPGEIVHVLNHSEAKVLVCSRDYVDLLRDGRRDLPHLQQVLSMEDQPESADLGWRQALEQGADAISAGDRAFEQVALDAADTAAIIFTSGTMGSSKAVMLTQGNIAFDVVATSQYVGLAGDTVLSVLPLHHTYECTGGFLTALYQGCTICHAENLRRIPENLLETRATVMLGVPLLFESMYRRIEAGIKEKGEGKFRFAKSLAAIAEKLFRKNIRRKLFKALHEKFGGRLRLFICGGAALNPAVGRGFRELGIDFIQGYGMTEAAPIITVNRVDCFKDDAVGLPLSGVEVKIIDGEVVARGPNVMKGYFRNEKATQETLKEGWLYTGDLGYFDDDGFLHLTGRKKSVIVTPNGKNVYPEEVETALNRSPYILESLVWGGPEEDPALIDVQAIIVPRLETFDQKFGPQNYDEEAMRKVIANEVKRCCEDLANYKRVKKFTLRHQEFEKTTTRKIKRYLYTGTSRPLPV